MTYALGRSLDYRDMPTVRRIVRQAAADDYRFKSIVLGVVSSDAFRKTGSRRRRDRSRLHRRSHVRRRASRVELGPEESSDVPVQEASVTAHRPQGRRRDHRAPVAGCHDPGRNGAGADRRRRRARAWASSTSRTARSRTSGQPKKTGRDFDFPFILKPLEPLRDYVTVVSGLRNKGGESSSPHGIIEETWLNCVSPRQRNAKTGVGITVDQIAAKHLGQGHVAAVAGAVRRARRHDLVPHAGAAAADGEQSAQGVLQHVRPGRYEGRARGHSEHDGQPARLRARRDGQPEPQARCRRPRQGERLPRFGPRDRTAACRSSRRTPSRCATICRVRRSARRRISASCSTSSSR